MLKNSIEIQQYPLQLCLEITIPIWSDDADHEFCWQPGLCWYAILGGYLAIQNVITVGDIQAFIQYVSSFTQPITQIANISNVLQQTAAAAERVFEFLDEEEEIPEVD